jgi:hypothetical protein
VQGLFIGCGTSYNAALAARSIVEELSGVPGLNNTLFKFTNYSNAYLPVYVRESDIKVAEGYRERYLYFYVAHVFFYFDTISVY